MLSFWTFQNHGSWRQKTSPVTREGRACGLPVWLAAAQRYCTVPSYACFWDIYLRCRNPELCWDALAAAASRHRGFPPQGSSRASPRSVAST
ncbi:g9598 [Coccomyxa viridis]|uniref:G9598 protein n=1 Tax=Coccomyxa viridis TaxID=1274662 RepID=A0ABP1G3F3_9CHLO